MERRKSGVKKVSAIDRLSKSKNKLSFKSAANKFRNKQTLDQMVKLAKLRQDWSNAKGISTWEFLPRNVWPFLQYVFFLTRENEFLQSTKYPPGWELDDDI